MLSLTKMYRPITAQPFGRSDGYRELLPCKALTPYIRCFWTYESCPDMQPQLVIPDTCMDIIYIIDTEIGKVSECFCTIDEKTHLSSSIKDGTSVFAIRFYAWTASLFSSNSFAGTANSGYSPEDFFPYVSAQLVPMLLSIGTLEERTGYAEQYLMKLLRLDRMNCRFMNTVHDILLSGGSEKISDLAEKNVISKKTLERIFSEKMGISPKSFSSLVRYQRLWQDICSSESFDILEAVVKYGYTDQSHLLKDFKKYHSMTPAQAVRYAQMSLFYNTNTQNYDNIREPLKTSFTANFL